VICAPADGTSLSRRRVFACRAPPANTKTRFSNGAQGSTGCNGIPRGSFYNDTDRSESLCPKGYTCEGGGADATPCDPGRYAPDKGSVACIACAPGRFASVPAAFECGLCPKGYYQEHSNASSCEEKKDGDLVLDGGIASVKVPLGSYIHCTQLASVVAAESCTFSPCPAGKYGKNPPDEEPCKDCPAGKSSFNSSIECVACSKGKFAQNRGTDCKNCPSGFFQPQSTDASVSKACQECPAGYSKDGPKGESACEDLNFVHPEDCTSEQYLNDTDPNRKMWICESCPDGGSCTQNTAKWTTRGPKFGFWKIPERQRGQDYWKEVFAECIYHPACLGGPNPSLKGRYFYSNGADRATTTMADDLNPLNRNHSNTTCATELGFRAASRLCHACAAQYRRQGSSECARCPATGQNWGLILLGIFLIASMLVYVVHSTLGEGGEEDLSQSVQKIMLNYLQVRLLGSKSF